MPDAIADAVLTDNRTLSADDTNTRVREIQKRGLADQPAEEADRQEGREHRGPEGP